MSSKTSSITFVLNPESIDEASEWFIENTEQLAVEKQDRVRARLLFEEALLNVSEHFGEDQEVTAFLERVFGRYRLRLTVKGEPFNPLRTDESNQDEWTISLFSVIQMHAQYSYGMGVNVVRLPLPKKTKNPVLRIIIAIAIGALAGLLGNALIPDSIEYMITDAVLGPITDMWLRLLQAISGPIIFFTMLTAAFGTKRISDYGGSRFVTVARYFGISAVVVVFTMIISFALFPFDITLISANRDTVQAALSEILKIVPGNLLEPFFSADTPQLLLIAIVAGYALAAMGDKAIELKQIIRQINMLGLVIAEKACRLVPYFVGLLLCLKIWTHETELLGLIWMPLVVAMAIAAIVFTVVVLVVSARTQVRPLLLVRKLKDPFVEALRTGSLDYSSVNELADTCKKLLGIDTEFSKAVLPQGLVLYMPTSAIGIGVFVLFAAKAQNVAIDQMWLLAAAGLAIVLAVATPPLNGANLLAFVVAFSYLGIPDAAFLDVMVFDIVFGVPCIALDQSMMQLETILQADRMGSLDTSVLRAPL